MIERQETGSRTGSEPRVRRLLHSLATFLQMTGDTDGSVEKLRKVAGYYESIGDLVRLRKTYERIVSLDPGHSAERELYVLDWETGELLLELPPDKWRVYAVFPRPQIPIGVIRSQSTNEYWLIGPDGSRRVSIPGDIVSELWVLPQGGFIVRRCSTGTQRIEQLDEHGEIARVLYEVVDR